MVNRLARVCVFLLLLIFMLSVPLEIVSVEGNNRYSVEESSNAVKAVLMRTPAVIYSRQAAVIFARVDGFFSRIRLNTTVNLELTYNSRRVLSRSISVKLPMVPVPQSPGWYFTSIPGLPSKSLDGFKISSKVSYALLVDGVEVASGGYSVEEGGVESRLHPLVTASVYSILNDHSLLKETLGLGPRGWRVVSSEDLKTLVVAVDRKGIENVSLGYSVDGGTWQSVSIREDPLMGNVRYMASKLNDAINKINTHLPRSIPTISLSILIYNGTIPGQDAGHYIMFRASATNVNGDSSSSLYGFYYVVNGSSDTKVLVVDPHVKLWLLSHNFRLLASEFKNYFQYKVPDDIVGNISLFNKIGYIASNYDIEPFHNWHTLGKHFNIYIVWPDKDAINTVLQDWRPNVIFLSNLEYGFNTSNKFFDWDLRDLGIFSSIINYVKDNHAGLIASHGTLSDWIAWLGCEKDENYKIGSRGHVGYSIDDVNIDNESTVAAALGMPQLALWEVVRDKIAHVLCSTQEMREEGMFIGSLPLQIPGIPFNGSMEATVEARSLGLDIPNEFNVRIPSLYNEFNISAYSEAGWQLAMPRVLAYAAFQRAKEGRLKTERLYNKVSMLFENVSKGFYPRQNTIRHLNSTLGWGIRSFYRSLATANISDGFFNMSMYVPGLKKNITVNIDVARVYNRLLSLYPVKIVAMSKEGLAGIVAYDKYWSEEGYRSIYFSYEAEASVGDAAEEILVQAVNWTRHWSYKNVSMLLGGSVRVPRDMAIGFSEKLQEIPGNITFSRGLILNEEGHSIVKLNTSKHSLLHILIAHPTTDKVNITVVGGGNISIISGSKGVTEAEIYACSGGSIKLSISADAESSINPVYITVKEETDTSPPTVSYITVKPQTGEAGTIFTISANVTDPSKVDLVTCHIFYKGQEITGFELFDDGQHHDGKAGDGIYGNIWNSANTSVGTYSIMIFAEDTLGNAEEYYNLTIVKIIQLTPPKFEIVNLSISPDKIEVGRTTEIAVDIVNRGDVKGKYTVVLRINGSVEETRNITLEGGGRKTLLFEVSEDAAGVYEVEVNGFTGIFTVTKIPTTITASVSKGNVKVGEEQVVTGRIEPSVPGVEVTITYVKAGGVKIVHKVSTASDGSFKDVIKPDAGGTWTVKASWEGNEKYEGAVSEEITFEAVERRCIVATATYGSELVPEVQFLRGFRESITLKTYAGREFMKLFNMWYYSWSPYVASVIWRHQMLRPIMQVILYPLLGILHISTYAYNIFSFNSEFAIFTAGLTAATLIGLIYFTPLIGLVMLILRSRKILLSKNMRNKILKALASVWIASILLLIVGELYSPITLMIGTGIFIIITITIVTGMATLKIISK